MPLWLAWVWLLAYHFFAYSGHNGFDDMLYAELANGWNQGNFVAEDHFSYRWGILLPTALFYRLFGISDWSSSLPALLATGLCLWLVWRQVRPWGLYAIWAGVGLVALDAWTLAYSDQLMTDALVSFSVMWAWVAYARHYYGPKHSPARQGISFALALGFGLVTKGTIVLLAPVIFLLMLYDMLIRRKWRFWMWAVAIGVIILIGYAGLLGYLTGDPMVRFRAIAGNAYQNACSYFLQPREVLIHRITQGWALDLLRQGLWAPLIVGLLTLRIKRNALAQEQQFWAWSVGLLILSSNFMTVSLEHYQPLCIDVRHYLFLVPIAAIAAAPLIQDWLKHGKHGLVAGILLLIAGSIAFSKDYPAAHWLYLPLGTIMLLHALGMYRAGYRSWWEKTSAKPLLLLSVWLLGLSLFAFQRWKENRQIEFSERRDAVKAYLLQPQDSTPIITDRIWANLGPYYANFSPEVANRFRTFRHIDTLSLPAEEPFYLLMDGYTQFIRGYQYEDWPFWMKDHPPGTDTLYQSSKGFLHLYRLPGLPPLEKIQHVDWGNHPIDEFALTNVWPIDSLRVLSRQAGMFLFNFEAEAWAQNNMAQLRWVVTVEGKDQTVLVWRGEEFQHQLKALTTWWPVKAEIDLTVQEIREGKMIKTYLWNPEKVEARVRNATVSLKSWSRQ